MTAVHSHLDRATDRPDADFELSVLLPFGFDPDAEFHLLQALGSLDSPSRWQLVAADCGDEAAISILLSETAGDITLVEAPSDESSALTSALARCTGQLTWMPIHGDAVTAAVLGEALRAIRTSESDAILDERFGLIAPSGLLADVRLRMPQLHLTRRSLLHALAAELAATGAGVAGPAAQPGEDLTPLLLSLVDDGRASALAMRLLSTSPAIEYNPSAQAGSDYLGSMTTLANQLAPSLGGASSTLTPGLNPTEFGGRALRGMWREFSEYCRESAPQAQFWAEHISSEALPSALPPAHIIVLVSDPRDVWASLAARDHKPALPALAGLVDASRRSALEAFQRSVTELVHRRYPEAARVLLVRYEDLLQDLSHQSHRLASWLGTTLDAQTLLMEIPGLGAAQESEPRWAQELTADEVRLFTDRLGRELAALGYPAATEAQIDSIAAREQRAVAGRVPAARVAATGLPATSLSPGMAGTERVLGPETLDAMNDVRWWHRIRLGVTEQGLPVYTPGQVRHGADGEDYATNRFGLPRNMTGLRVADIGGWDGFFSFEAERRNAAEVTVFDVDQTKGGNWGGTLGFQFAKKTLESSVGYVNAGIYDITPEQFGQFDVAFFFGVLYHLKEPLTAIERLFDMVAPGGFALIETARAQPTWIDEKVCAWVYAPGLENDPTNYFYPTPVALDTTLTQVGFTTVRAVYDDGGRYTVLAAK